MITIHLDEQALQLPPGSTLAELLVRQQRTPESVATARNGEFVAREARAGIVLSDGDRILLFKPIVGG